VLGQRRPHLAPHAPDHVRQLEASRFGQVPGPLDPVAALARGLDRNGDGDGGEPGRRARGDEAVGVVLGAEKHDRVRAAARGDDPALGDLDPRPRDVEVRVEVERDERERGKVERSRRPRRRVWKVGGEVGAKAGIVEAARVEPGRDLHGFDGPRRPHRAPREERRRRKECPSPQATRRAPHRVREGVSATPGRS
jgi:hypothetical protein